MSLKDKLVLSTDRGQDWKGLLYIAAAAIFAMPDDWERTALITLWFGCMAWVSWITRGNVLPAVAEEINTAGEPEFASDRDKGLSRKNLQRALEERSE